MIKAFIATATAIRSALTSGLLRIAGPAAGTTRTMTVPDANFTAARTDAAQSFAGVQTFTAGAIIGSPSVSGQVVSARQNYWQISDTRVVSATVDFLKISFVPGTYNRALSIRICSRTYADTVGGYSRVEEIYVTGTTDITSKLSHGDTTADTVSYAVSGDDILFTYTKTNGNVLQRNMSYIEIVGINGSASESAITVTIL